MAIELVDLPIEHADLTVCYFYGDFSDFHGDFSWDFNGDCSWDGMGFILWLWHSQFANLNMAQSKEDLPIRFMDFSIATCENLPRRAILWCSYKKDQHFFISQH